MARNTLPNRKAKGVAAKPRLSRRTILLLLIGITAALLLAVQLLGLRSSNQPNNKTNGDNSAFWPKSRLEFAAFEKDQVSTASQAMTETLNKELEALGVNAREVAAKSTVDGCFTQSIDEGFTVATQIKRCYLRQTFLYGATNVDSTQAQWLVDSLNSHGWQGNLGAVEGGKRHGSFGKTTSAGKLAIDIYVGPVDAPIPSGFDQKGHSDHDAIFARTDSFDEAKVEAELVQKGYGNELRVVFGTEYYNKEYWRK